MNNLLASSLALALFGTLLLSFFTATLQPTMLEISEIGSEHIGKFVSVRGEVKSVFAKDGNVFIELCDTACMKITIFKNIARSQAQPSPYDLRKGDFISVSGTVEEYNGKLSITPFSKNSLSRA